jgi:hypothetical protein
MVAAWMAQGGLLSVADSISTSLAGNHLPRPLEKEKDSESGHQTQNIQAQVANTHRPAWNEVLVDFVGDAEKESGKHHGQEQ